MTLTLLQLAPRLTLLLFLAGIASGCSKQAPDPSTQGGATSQLHTTAQGNPLHTPTADKPSSSQPENSGPQQDSAMPWLVQPGILGISNGDWLSISALAFGVLGTGLGIHGWIQASRIHDTLNQHKRNLNNRQTEINNITSYVNSMTRPMEVHSEQMKALQSRLLQLESQQQSFGSTIHQLQNQAASHQQALNPSLTNPLKQTPESPPPPPPAPAPAPAQLQVELTAAFNLGDRQAYKNQIHAQLNITSTSENDIAMGRLSQTQLEEVTGGGSYWMATIAGDTWLYPTEQTLKGFAQFQPSKGIFLYRKEAISTPKVLAPARLAAAGSCWQITELGSIAIPG